MKSKLLISGLLIVFLAFTNISMANGGNDGYRPHHQHPPYHHSVGHRQMNHHHPYHHGHHGNHGRRGHHGHHGHHHRVA